jgi:hypothetical protein
MMRKDFGKLLMCRIVLLPLLCSLRDVPSFTDQPSKDGESFLRVSIVTEQLSNVKGGESRASDSCLEAKQGYGRPNSLLVFVFRFVSLEL